MLYEQVGVNMKLQISFDMADLDQALIVAQQVVDQCDSFAIGNTLLCTYGIELLRVFRTKFPQKTLLLDTKLACNTDIIPLIAQTDMQWITILAGSPNETIRALCKEAHKHNLKVMLDLFDSSYKAQSAMEAKNLGADALLFYQPYQQDLVLNFQDTWDMIKSNASLPLYISAEINRENLDSIIPLKPHGMIIGTSITQAKDPSSEAQYYYNILKG